MDIVETTLSKHFKTFKVHSEPELKTLLKNEHIFCIVVGFHIRENTELLKIRKLRAAFTRTPTLVYAKVHEPEVGFQLGKSGVDEFIPNPNIDQLLEKLHQLKEQATFRIDLREFGIDLNQCKNYWTKQFLKSILNNHNFLKYCTVSEFANKFGISTEYLNRAVKKDCILPPKQWLLCLRNYYAAYLLDTTEWPLQIIVHRCGFTNEQMFSKCFKIKTGIPPTNFQREKHWRKFPALYLENIKQKSIEATNQMKIRSKKSKNDIDK